MNKKHSRTKERVSKQNHKEGKNIIIEKKGGRLQSQKQPQGKKGGPGSQAANRKETIEGNWETRCFSRTGKHQEQGKWKGSTKKKKLGQRNRVTTQKGCGSIDSSST